MILVDFFLSGPLRAVCYDNDGQKKLTHLRLVSVNLLAAAKTELLFGKLILSIN